MQTTQAAKASVWNSLGTLYVRSAVRDVEWPSPVAQCVWPSVWGGALCVRGTHNPEGQCRPLEDREEFGPHLFSFMHSFLTPRESVNICVAPLGCVGSCGCAYPLCLLGMVHSCWLAGLSLFCPEDPGPPTHSSSESRVEEPFSVDRAAGIVSR